MKTGGGAGGNRTVVSVNGDGEIRDGIYFVDVFIEIYCKEGSLEENILTVRVKGICFK